MTTHATIPTHASMRRPAKSLTRHLPAAARVLMGLVLLASGVFGLLMAAGVIPMPQPPTPPPEGAAAFVGALMKPGYLLVLIKGTEACVGALLLTNRFVALALTLFAPVLVNILAFHAFLAPSGIGPGLALTVLEIYLAWTYRAAYRPLLATRAAAGAE